MRLTSSIWPACVFFFVVFLLNGLPAHSQDRSNSVWVFGDGVTVDFSSGLVTIDRLPGFSDRLLGLVSSYSDPVTGELLFFADRWRVWRYRDNRTWGNLNHNNPTSTYWHNAQIILPAACPGRYFIFWANNHLYDKGQQGISYSMYDIDINNGYGGFIHDKSNVLVLRQAPLRTITAIHNGAQSGYWLIGHTLKGKNFATIKVGGEDVEDMVISTRGFSFEAAERAVLKVSPGGSKIAMSTQEGDRVQILNFNNGNGKVQEKNTPIPEISKAAQALEFSPDGSKLYTTEIHDAGAGWRLELWQYDLNAPNIDSSGTRIHTVGEFNSTQARHLGHANLAFGMDGKMYLAAPTRPWLYRVHGPNSSAEFVQIDSLKLPKYLPSDDSFVNQYIGKPIKFVAPNVVRELNISPSQTICRGDSVVLEVLNNYPGDYEWSPSQGLPDPKARSIIVAPQENTTYSVRFVGKCTRGSAEVTIKVGPKPIVRVSGDQTICEGETVELTASGARTYRWSPEDGLDAIEGRTVLASPRRTTVYTVIGFTADGCADTAKVEVKVNPVPEFDLGADKLLCPGERVQLRARDGVEYRWWPDLEISDVNNPSTWVSPTADRTYYVEVTNAAGCSKIDSVRIRLGVEPRLPEGLTFSICQGNAVQLQHDGPEGKYRWSPSTGLDNPRVKHPRARPESSTLYTVQLETECGSAQAQVEVAVTKRPKSLLEDRTICAGFILELNSQGDPAFQHRWEEHPDIADLNAVNPSVQPQETSTYHLTIGSGDCIVKDSVRIYIGTAPPLTLSSDTRVCAGNSVQLRAEGADDYEWTPAEGLSDARSATPKASPSKTTMYYVKGFSRKGCERLDSVLVEVLPQPNISLEPAAPRICRGESIQLTLNSTVALESVRWNPSIGLNDPESLEPIATLNASQTYQVEYKSINGCRGQYMVEVIVSPPPLLDLDNDLVEICANAQPGIATIVRASGAEDYVWFDIEGIVVNRGPVWEVPNSQLPGLYRVVGGRAGGCSAERVMEIRHLDLPVVTVPDFYRICAGESVQLNATGGVRYKWTPSTGLDNPGIARPRATPISNTEYLVEVFNEFGCSVSRAVRLELESRAQVQLTSTGVSGHLLPGDEFDLHIEVDLAAYGEMLNRSSIRIELDYPAGSLENITIPALNAGVLPGWKIEYSEQLAAGKLIILGTGDGTALLPQFRLNLEMRLLVFQSLENVLRIRMDAGDLGASPVCDLFLGEVELPLSNICLMPNRSVLLTDAQFGLSQNSPNPTDGQTHIVYSLGFETHVELLLTDNLGRVVRRLVDERLAAGTHTLELSTAELGSGQYRYTLRAGPFSATRILIVR